ncbi:MAG: rhomboid family intramembrane serine protease [Rhodobacteraceae bacterium]|nr:MAG: rhomboid family intramembrane serine protease [Paracoccaceae bacterium]
MRNGAPPVVWAFAAIFLAIELMLTASDVGYLPRGWRFAAYQRFAFFDLFFEAFRSGQNVPINFYWSFVTHAFLHGGFAHLGMNTVVFLALGAHMCRAVGEAAMVGLFFLTAAGGALAFGLIANTGLAFIPMVGASGALFGFLGAIKRWEWRYVREHHLPTRRFWSTILALVLINVILSVGVGFGGGGVAWEAHFGGFVAGWLAAGLLTPRRGAAIGPI